MDASPVIHAWSILRQAVVPVIVSPTEEATLSESTPTLSGTAAPHAPSPFPWMGWWWARPRPTTWVSGASLSPLP
ncbi:hypothetical protein ACN28S_33145 [Cystobacter fuscus]